MKYSTWDGVRASSGKDFKGWVAWLFPDSSSLQRLTFRLKAENMVGAACKEVDLHKRQRLK